MERLTDINLELQLRKSEHESAIAAFQRNRTPEGAAACRAAYNRYLEVNKRLQRYLEEEKAGGSASESRS